jgi:hypothetical protein
MCPLRHRKDSTRRKSGEPRRATEQRFSTPLGPAPEGLLCAKPAYGRCPMAQFQSCSVALSGSPLFLRVESLRNCHRHHRHPQAPKPPTTIKSIDADVALGIISDTPRHATQPRAARCTSVPTRPSYHPAVSGTCRPPPPANPGTPSISVARPALGLLTRGTPCNVSGWRKQPARPYRQSQRRVRLAPTPSPSLCPLSVARTPCNVSGWRKQPARP